jgi:AhpD family alkylhydroperoxidase
MEARMENPAMAVPGAFPALRALGEASKDHGVSDGLLELCHLRASQINGCSVCAVMHPRLAKKNGETDDRLFAVGAWRDAPYFSEAERAALALTECVTRIADRPDPVPDDVWDEAARHFDAEALAALVLSIASINVWNRLNLATRQVAGEAWD